MINAPEQHIVPVIPSPEQFAEWVSGSLERLKKRPSHYLLEEGVPGSKNRVSNFIKNPEFLRLHLACELQRQILTDAVRYGVNLDPIKIQQLSSIIRSN
ncbi:hypothetical protein K3555_11880 [Leisingera sp. M527]|uniref:hypothetical protein n=1 Tax=unclassified Leisingera TaxID=2614906 RepID=UPI0021A82C62|nr:MULTISPECIES: hypothetical protein [unclassified Leisingera]UWQ31309.1 hypothetical protein K3555_11880 [Leisingera sp. M527]UWQ76796.1 hypothetical protein K3724_10355 [Leisingera sp. M658]